MTIARDEAKRGSSGQSGVYRHVQYMRAVAAIMVVYFHTKVYLPHLAWPIDRSFGYAGVDIFFVISGFIITTTNLGRRRSPGRFLLDRALRIYPPYWFALTLALALFWIAPSAFTKDAVDLRYIIASYLLAPIDNATGSSGGVPFLKIAWTLVFEVYFYIVFAAALPIASARVRALLVTAFMTSMVVFGVLVPQPAPPMAFLTQPIVLEFLFGCWVALLVADGRFDCARGICWAGALISFGLILVGGGHGDQFGRVIHFGIPAAALILFLTLLERDFGCVLKSPAFLLLGDASYSIYLFHPFVLTAARLLTTRLWPHGSAIAGVCLSVLAAIVVGLAVHLSVEKPLLTFGRRMTSRRVSANRPGFAAGPNS